MNKKALVLATRNRDKSREIRDIFRASGIIIWDVSEFPQAPEVEETGKTLEANALLKARTIFKILKLPVLADDTGLEVLALNNAPGVYSARYAGENVSYEENNYKLLHEMFTVPAGKRAARFRCVSAFVAEGVEHTVEGTCTGAIATELRGKQGFGYDPLFIPMGFDKTFAELDMETKNRLSHRAEAFRAMKDYLIKLDF